MRKQLLSYGLWLIIALIFSNLPKSAYGEKVWQKEVIDSSGQISEGVLPGKSVFIKMSQNNIPVISFLSSPNRQLRFRYKQAGEWKDRETDPSFIQPYDLSVTVDLDENIHLGLIKLDETTNRTKVIYSYSSGKTWFLEDIDQSRGAYEIDMLLDSNGFPKICYISFDDSLPELGWRTGIFCRSQNIEGWKGVRVTATNGRVEWLSVGLNSKDFFHILYSHTPYDLTGVSWYSDLGYEYETESGWQIGVTIDGGAGNPQHRTLYNKVLIDSKGYPHTVYVRDFGPSGNFSVQLIHKYENAVGWHEEIIDTSAWINNISAAIDSNDNLHISYTPWKFSPKGDFVTKVLYGYWNNHTWELSEIDSCKRGGYDPEVSISIDSYNHPHVAYISPEFEKDQFVYYNLVYGTILTETISTPSNPSGEISGIIGKTYKYSTGGSSSNLGHTIEYQFDWKGDGSDLSAWGSATQSKAWTTAGVYNVRGRARCTQDTSIVSDWSNPLTVSISLPKISVTPTAYNFGNVKVKKSKTGSFRVKNSGTVYLLISSSITGTGVSMFTITNGGGSKTIKPGKTLIIKVAFKPTSTGSKTSTLKITSNDPDTPKVDIPLTGTGQ